MTEAEAGRPEDAAATASQLFAALASGDSDRACGLLHPEVIWTPMRLSGLGVLRSRSDAEKWIRQYGPGFGRISIEVSRMAALGGWIVVLGTLEDNRRRSARRREAGWRVAITDGLVVEAHAADTWDDTIFAAEHQAPQVVGEG